MGPHVCCFSLKSSSCFARDRPQRDLYIAIAAIFGLGLLVGVGVLFAGFLGVMRRVQVMAVRQMGVVSRLLVLGGAMMSCGSAMVLGCGFVMLGGLLVMFSQQACVHELSSSAAGNMPRAPDRTSGR
jgi:hypothetical protein